MGAPLARSRHSGRIQQTPQVSRNDARNATAQRLGPTLLFAQDDALIGPPQHHLGPIQQLRQTSAGQQDTDQCPAAHHQIAVIESVQASLRRGATAASSRAVLMAKRAVRLWISFGMVGFFQSSFLPLSRASGWRSSRSARLRTALEARPTSRSVSRISCCSGASLESTLLA